MFDKNVWKTEDNVRTFGVENSNNDERASSYNLVSIIKTKYRGNEKENF